MGPRKLQRLRPRWAATFPVTNPWPSRLCLPLGADSTPHPTPRFGSVSAFQTGRLVSRTTVDAERAEGACAPARSTSTQPPGCPRRAPILPGPPQCRPRPPPAGGGGCCLPGSLPWQTVARPAALGDRGDTAAASDSRRRSVRSLSWGRMLHFLPFCGRQAFRSPSSTAGTSSDVTSCICGGRQGLAEVGCNPAVLSSSPGPPRKLRAPAAVGLPRDTRRDEASRAGQPSGVWTAPRCGMGDRKRGRENRAATGHGKDFPDDPREHPQKLSGYPGLPENAEPRWHSSLDRPHLILLFPLFGRIAFLTGFETHPQSIHPRYGRWLPPIIQSWCYLITEETRAKFSNGDTQKGNALGSLPLPACTQGHRMVPPQVTPRSGQREGHQGVDRHLRRQGCGSVLPPRAPQGYCSCKVLRIHPAPPRTRPLGLYEPTALPAARAHLQLRTQALRDNPGSNSVATCFPCVAVRPPLATRFQGLGNCILH